MSNKKFKLSVNLAHPNKSFRVGRHEIGVQPAIYELNESEQKELNTAGPKKWIVVHENNQKADDEKLAREKAAAEKAAAEKAAAEKAAAEKDAAEKAAAEKAAAEKQK